MIDLDVVRFEAVDLAEDEIDFTVPIGMGLDIAKTPAIHPLYRFTGWQAMQEMGGSGMIRRFEADMRLAGPLTVVTTSRRDLDFEDALRQQKQRNRNA